MPVSRNRGSYEVYMKMPPAFSSFMLVALIGIMLFLCNQSGMNEGEKGGIVW